MTLTLTLALDIVMALLLVATIVFAAILNTRLNALRRNKDQLGRLIGNFNEATLRAESGIPKLRKAAEEAGQALHEQVDRAQTLRDDLAFLIERADSMAAHLEGTVRVARGEAKPNRPAAAAARRPLNFGLSPAPIEEMEYVIDDERSEAERELLRALRSVR
ncbi:MAG: hypothetical protein FD149_2436 [Rhodospirillaceae bacterium]|nr:MAG: hypothetical protein FD149_2436 [Rhodospirillaceae bacterium]